MKSGILSATKIYLDAIKTAGFGKRAIQRDRPGDLGRPLGWI